MFFLQRFQTCIIFLKFNWPTTLKNVKRHKLIHSVEANNAHKFIHMAADVIYSRLYNLPDSLRKQLPAPHPRAAYTGPALAAHSAGPGPYADRWTAWCCSHSTPWFSSPAPPCSSACHRWWRSGSTQSSSSSAAPSSPCSHAPATISAPVSAPHGQPGVSEKTKQFQQQSSATVSKQFPSWGPTILEDFAIRTDTTLCRFCWRETLSK